MGWLAVAAARAPGAGWGSASEGSRAAFGGVVSEAELGGERERVETRIERGPAVASRSVVNLPLRVAIEGAQMDVGLEDHAITLVWMWVCAFLKAAQGISVTRPSPARPSL
jgi:hypothetical protein